MGMAMLALFWSLKPFFSGSTQIIGLIIAILAIGAPLTYWFSRAERIDPTRS